MTGIAVGTCARCGAATSYFARACPNCHTRNLPNPIAAITLLAAVLLAGGLIALGWRGLRGGEAPQNPPAATAPSATQPTTAATADYGWLITAMAECEAQAKVGADAMRFLIIPVAATGVSLPGWAPGAVGSVGGSITLLHSTDALIGLKNGAFKLYPKPVTFALSDPKTKTVYKWNPAAGVTELTSREIGAGELMLGFDVPDQAKEIAWGPTINLKKGACYWINPLLPTAARNP
jgi:hypothetical protein